MLPDDLARLRVALEAMGRPARVLEHTGSTNDDARAWASEGIRAGAVVVADAQRSGRGRQGRSWSTPPTETLALSVVLRPDLAPSALPPLSIVAGLAVRSAIARRLTADVLVKWPNDVLVAGRKIAGILVESALHGGRVDAVVVGVGVNVERTEFPDELRGRATSLALEGALSLDRCALALDLLASVDREVSIHVASMATLPARLRPHDALLGKDVTVDGRAAVADGIEPDGRLRVVFEDGGIGLVAAGEVVLR